MSVRELTAADHMAHCDYSMRPWTDTRRDYSHYDAELVSECEKVQTLVCAHCNARFDTDPLRRCPCGWVFYMPVNRLILYCRPRDRYYCLAHCWPLLPNLPAKK